MDDYTPAVPAPALKPVTGQPVATVTIAATTAPAATLPARSPAPLAALVVACRASSPIRDSFACVVDRGFFVESDMIHSSVIRLLGVEFVAASLNTDIRPPMIEY